MKKIIFLQALFFISLLTNGQAPPQSANAIMEEAYATAGKENKKVLIIFHASWCGWCHKMDTSLNDISCKKFFDDNFVIRHLVVYESKGKELLENPGAQEMLKKYNGGDSGIPYWLVFDKDRTFLADSRMPPKDPSNLQFQNTGCPASKEEVEYFISVLKKTTNLNEKQLEIIKERFRKNEPVKTN